MTVAISASLVKELRDQTGAGMMDCKRALEETGGDVEAAPEPAEEAPEYEKLGQKEETVEASQ